MKSVNLDKATFQEVTLNVIATVVIPCYNEEKRLNQAEFLRFASALPNLKFVFVNDGSRDNTLKVLEQMRESNPVQIHVLDLAKNSGTAEAVRQGLLYALEFKPDFIGYWDADLATPLYSIMDFVTIGERFNDLDVIYGARTNMLGHKIDRKLSRRMVSIICSIMARLAIGIPISDTQVGAKLFRVTPNLRKALQAKFTAQWLFDVELFVRINRGAQEKAARFYEYPLAEWTEVPGSKVNVKAVVQSGLIMLRLIGSRFFFKSNQAY